MPTAIDIASNALLLVGDNPISAFDSTEGGQGALVASALYPETYKSVLAEHPWSFALKEQRLNKLSQTPDPETHFKFAYQIPTDNVRILAILPHSDYAIVGQHLYSNQNDLLARYTYEPEEVQLPPHFVKALEYKLAADFAIAITENASKNELYERKYRAALAQARHIDSSTHPPMPIIDKPFSDARFSGFRPGVGMT